MLVSIVAKIVVALRVAIVSFVGRVLIVVMIIIMMIIIMMLVVIMVIGMRFSAVVMRLGEAMRVIMFTGMLVVGGSEGVRLVIMALEFMTLGLRRRRSALDDLAPHPFAAAAAARRAMTIAAAVRAVLGFFLCFAMGALFRLDQGLTVGDRDLIVVRMNFAEGEKAVTVAAIFDEGSLQGRFYPRDFGKVDIAAQLLALGRLEIKFLDAVATNDNDPGLFRVGSIDQHLVGHIGTLGGDGRSWPRARGALSDDATVHLIRG
jgi:hypothetical protein